MAVTNFGLVSFLRFSTTNMLSVFKSSGWGGRRKEKMEEKKAIKRTGDPPSPPRLKTVELPRPLS